MALGGLSFDAGIGNFGFVKPGYQERQNHA